MIKKIRPKGQSAVEFVLVVPLIFFIFFGIIQIAYMAYASLAVQRATLSIAKSSARSQIYDPHFQLFYSLVPLEALNKSTLATVLSTQCTIQSDGSKIHVEVKYPMPIWVPLVGRWMGEPLPSSQFTGILGLDMVEKIFLFCGKTPPDLSFLGFTPPYVHWVTFTADTTDENSIHI